MLGTGECAVGGESPAGGVGVVHKRLDGINQGKHRAFRAAASFDEEFVVVGKFHQNSGKTALIRTNKAEIGKTLQG